MTPTFRDPRTGETVALEREVPPGGEVYWRGGKVFVEPDEIGDLRVELLGGGLVVELLEGDIDNPADVQRALDALSRALGTDADRRIADAARALLARSEEHPWQGDAETWRLMEQLVAAVKDAEEQTDE